MEGLVRAVMAVTRLGASEAKTPVKAWEEHRVTVQETYGLLQNLIGDRIIVDESPSYTTK